MSFTEDPTEDTDIVDPTEESEDVSGTEESDNGDSDSTDADGVKKEVDWSKRYKDIQSHSTKIEQENRELREKLAELSGKVDVIASINERTEPKAKSWIEDEELVEKLRGDPAEVIGLLKTMRSEVANVLMSRDEALRNEIVKNDPRIAKLKGKVDELAKDPDYNGFSREQLVVIAAKTSKEEVADEDAGDEGEQRMSRNGASFGRRIIKQKKEAIDPVEDYWFKKIYGSMK